MNPQRKHRHWPWFRVTALCLLAYAYNVAARIAATKFGISLWRVGDVGEFVLVLVSMLIFVGGVLSAERTPDNPDR